MARVKGGRPASAERERAPRPHAMAFARKRHEDDDVRSDVKLRLAREESERDRPRGEADEVRGNIRNKQAHGKAKIGGGR